MPLAPKKRLRGGGSGAEGRTVGQTTAGGGGGGWAAAGGGTGPGRVGLALGVAPTACTFLINLRPADKRMSRVRGLIRKARFTRAEIAKAMANPNVNSSPLPKAPISSAHCIKIILNNSGGILKDYKLFSSFFGQSFKLTN